MLIDNHIIKDDQIIGISGFVTTKCKEFAATVYQFEFSIFTISNTITIRSHRFEIIGAPNKDEQKSLDAFKMMFCIAQKQVCDIMGIPLPEHADHDKAVNDCYKVLTRDYDKLFLSINKTKSPSRGSWLKYMDTIGKEITKLKRLARLEVQ